MFVDFYQLLEIPFISTQEEIKTAYRKQCIKWHPDKNPQIDTTQRMQDINQAYLILKDKEARSRYDKEYEIFKTHFENVFEEVVKTNSSTEYDSTHRQNYSYSEYKFNDDILEKWMENAKRQAHQMAKDAIDEFRGASKEAATSVTYYLVRIMIPMLLCFLIFKSCLN